jgi:hypothetical protein
MIKTDGIIYNESNEVVDLGLAGNTKAFGETSFALGFMYDSLNGCIQEST